MKKLIACYKAFRGGEWLQHSLDSIAEHVDGVVIVLSSQSWDSSGLTGNCEAAIERYAVKRPDWVKVVRYDANHQEEQYRVGLATIRESFGEDAAVLLIDTDEVWTSAGLECLRKAIIDNPQCHYFTGEIRTYIRSPLYQVYPYESSHPVVAIQSARPQTVIGRFHPQAGCGSMHCPGAAFHHFPYVRADVDEIAAKFAATSSQERHKSDPQWLTNIWPALPRGKQLHMTAHVKSYWGEIKVLPSPPITLPSFCQPLLLAEEQHWQNILEQESPHATLIPTPTDADALKYQEEFATLTSDPAMLRSRLKVLYLEAILLYQLAKKVPADGRILEIGSGAGGSLAAMAFGTNAALWAVDPFSPYDETTHAGTVRGVHEGNEGSFWATAYQYGYSARVRQIKHNSDVAAEHCPDLAFDIVFVDGNHSYEIARKDVELYWPKVKPGGCMLVHDYTTRFPGVIRAMKDWGHPYSLMAGTSLAYSNKAS